ncbi:MAG: tRNA epoxyqueuosine(34) reductase QueG [Gammaproteobacteria bacterium]|nr:tRNA epoxyqueuosine(34) reductase QueG [Gammaproteobacteria bacterium]
MLLRDWAADLGFNELRITDTDLSSYTNNHRSAIDQGLHGEMLYLERNQDLRYQPEKLLPGTTRIICARMNYLPREAETITRLQTPERAYIARYSLGRDYHKFMRKRLTQLAQRLEQHIGSFGYRAFVDSAPVLERQLAEKSGLGWIGKNTLLLNEHAGSWFLLGEIYTDLPLPLDQPLGKEHCGSCTKCLDICPTKAFIKPWLLDARRCISYLTIEYKGSIPLELRPSIGNRIFGCDDCQIFCPWTKFTEPSSESDFNPRHELDSALLTELFLWDENTFQEKTSGSAIRRCGYECWLRNIAVALGNAPCDKHISTVLQSRLQYPSELVREHTRWALDQQQKK